MENTMSNTATTTQHTRTPWIAEGSRIVSEAMRNLTIARVGISADGDYSPANAAFIVRACNAHEQLVAALKIASNDLAVAIEQSGKDACSDERIKRARAALAAAEA
jgi:hypothetical protein